MEQKETWELDDVVRPLYNIQCRNLHISLASSPSSPTSPFGPVSPFSPGGPTGPGIPVAPVPPAFNTISNIK